MLSLKRLHRRRAALSGQRSFMTNSLLPAKEWGTRWQIGDWLSKQRFGHLQGSVWVSAKERDSWTEELERREIDADAVFIVEGRSDEDRAVLATDDDDAVIAFEAERYGADASGFPVGSAGLGAPDVEIFSEDGHGQELRRSVAEAFKQGIAGFAVDRLVYSRPWTFDPGQITAPCEILHGEHDVAVDMAHAERLNDLIPASTLTRLDDHGHLSIIAELPALAARLTH